MGEDLATNFFDNLSENFTEDSSKIDECFKLFDKDKDEALSQDEFSSLLAALFRDGNGSSHTVDSKVSEEIFAVFNKAGNGKMNRDEFTSCWTNWITKIVHPTTALVVVDVQNDFITGSLPFSGCPSGHDGYEVVPPINKLLETVTFDAVFYCKDWHPQDHISFIENVGLRKLDASSPITDPESVKAYDTVVFEGPPKIEMKLWPAHCVQESWGSELNKDLTVFPGSTIIYKGSRPTIDSFSGFFDNQKLNSTELEKLLKAKNVTDVFVCGLATDVCVGHTALHALELGFRTIFLEDCSRGIDLDDIQKMLNKVRSLNGVVVNSSSAEALAKGRDRRVELGLKLALECKEK